MEIFKAILEYTAIGVTIVMLVDILASMTKKPNPISNQERVFMIIIWPITILLFIRSMFKNFK
jgi:hypothetical protein